MAIRTKAVLKTYFETGDYPTQQQFEDLIDSMHGKDTAIPITAIEGLLGILNSYALASQLGLMIPIIGNYNHLMPSTAGIDIVAGTLVKAIVVRGTTADAEVQIGTTLGGSDLGVVTLAAGTSEVVVAMRYFQSTGAIFIQSTQSLTYEIHR